MKHDYDFFLFCQLAYAYRTIDILKEYDIAFDDIVTLYEDFLNSDFNDGYKNLYDCIVDYLIQIKQTNK